MKKLIITLSIVALSFAAFSQKNQVKVGVKAGVSFPTISAVGGASAYDGPEPPDYKMNTSFYIGGTIDVPVSNLFSIQPGLTLIGKGGKAQVYFSNFEPGPGLYVYQGSYKLNTMYLDIPVNAVFNFNFGSGKIFFGGGPYYGFAVSGKTKTDGIRISGSDQTNQSSKQDVKFGKNEDLQRSDFGLNFLAGFGLNSELNIHLGYGLGLKTITGGSINYYQEKNRVLSVGFGFSL